MNEEGIQNQVSSSEEDQKEEEINKKLLEEEKNRKISYIAHSRARGKWFEEFPTDKESDIQYDSPTFINFYNQSWDEVRGEVELEYEQGTGFRNPL